MEVLYNKGKKLNKAYVTTNKKWIIQRDHHAQVLYDICDDDF